MEKFLATSNPNKARISGYERIILPTFDENQIHKELGNPSQYGHLYPLLVSKKKYLQMRGIPTEVHENQVLVVSDSVLAVRINGQTLPLNKDLNGMTSDEVMELIRLDDKVEFIGSVAFGIDNQTTISYLTFLALNPRLMPDFQVPIDLNQLIAKNANMLVDKGFISYSGFRLEQAGTILEARPFVSGLIPDLSEVIDKVFRLEAQNLVSLLRAQIAGYPFNNIIFYDLIAQGLSYEDIVNNWKDIFEKNGGNCSFHSLFLYENLKNQGLDPKIVLFPSKNPDHEQGHSAVLVEIEEDKYLMDPGLSIPFPLLVSGVPLIYNLPSGKTVCIYEKEGRIIMEVAKKDKTIKFLQQDYPLTEEEYRKKLPNILANLHHLRTVVKIDYHDQDGKLINRKERKL